MNLVDTPIPLSLALRMNGPKNVTHGPAGGSGPERTPAHTPCVTRPKPKERPRAYSPRRSARSPWCTHRTHCSRWSRWSSHRSSRRSWWSQLGWWCSREGKACPPRPRFTYPPTKVDLQRIIFQTGRAPRRGFSDE